MDGENNGKPYEQMDDLGGFPHYFWFNTHTFPPSKQFAHFFPKTLHKLSEAALKMMGFQVPFPST